MLLLQTRFQAEFEQIIVRKCVLCQNWYSTDSWVLRLAICIVQVRQATKIHHFDTWTLNQSLEWSLQAYTSRSANRWSIWTLLSWCKIPHKMHVDITTQSYDPSWTSWLTHRQWRAEPLDPHIDNSGTPEKLTLWTGIRAGGTNPDIMLGKVSPWEQYS